MADDAKGRALSRHETHDLGMIIKERTKVLKAHVDAEAAACLADFERQIAAVYAFDQDEVWKAAAEEAGKVAAEAQRKIAARCEALGIPKSFAPGLGVVWNERGENASRSRRAELRAVAKASVAAMAAAAIVKVEREGLDLRTQIVAMGLLSENAKAFLNTLKPVEEAMRRLDFSEVESKVAALKPSERARLRYDA